MGRVRVGSSNSERVCKHTKTRLIWWWLNDPKLVGLSWLSDASQLFPIIPPRYPHHPTLYKLIGSKGLSGRFWFSKRHPQNEWILTIPESIGWLHSTALENAAHRIQLNNHPQQAIGVNLLSNLLNLKCPSCNSRQLIYILPWSKERINGKLFQIICIERQ